VTILNLARISPSPDNGLLPLVIFDDTDRVGRGYLKQILINSS